MSQTQPAEPQANSDPAKSDKMIGARLRARRILLEWSQIELADKCGLSPQQIHKYETGQSRMTGGRLVQMATILEVPITFFFEGVGPRQVFSESLVTLLGDPRNTELLMIFAKLPEHTRIGLLGLLRSLATDAKTKEVQPGILHSVDETVELSIDQPTRLVRG